MSPPRLATGSAAPLLLLLLGGVEEVRSRSRLCLTLGSAALPLPWLLGLLRPPPFYRLQLWRVLRGANVYVSRPSCSFTLAGVVAWR